MPFAIQNASARLTELEGTPVSYSVYPMRFVDARWDGVNIMKGYMESGEFSRGKESIRGFGGIVMVGNFEVDVEHQQRLGHLLGPLPPTLVGIDHGFSFPLRYFEVHHLPPDWPTFLDEFQHHWPTDEDHTYVEFVRDGLCGNGADRGGNARFRRLTEDPAGSAAKSVFHFDVQGSVAKSAHAGIPWLRYLRQQLSKRIHFWPFDGWEIPAGRSAVVEVYPALWKHAFVAEGRTADQHDAYSVAAWLRQADFDGQLPRFLSPDLTPSQRTVAGVEGWILGVG